MRTIVISDCHAQPQLITNALGHAEFDWGKDKLIFAGDFLDIGDNPRECLRILEREDAQILWGNHEYAIVLRRRIWPQSSESWKFRDLLLDRFFAGEYKAAYAVDNVLVTHAGVSQVYQHQWEKCHEGVAAFADYLNDRFRQDTQRAFAYMAAEGDKRVGTGEMSEFEEDTSPLWFRPDLLRPLPGLVQVVGHTPPEYLTDRSGLGDYHMIDPYSRDLETAEEVMARYRYAVIENGVVTIHDSKAG